jgi:DNA polymerase/3'-5' exonuclease PolX
MSEQDIQRLVELERAEAVRKALEEAAYKLEAQAGNSVYMAAWRKAARLIRLMKP